MSTTVTPKPGKQLWGIYRADREEARTHDDPPRTTVEASSKSAAEEVAAKLGFSDPMAHFLPSPDLPHKQLSDKPVRQINRFFQSDFFCFNKARHVFKFGSKDTT